MISKHFTAELSGCTEKFVCGNDYLDYFITDFLLDDCIQRIRALRKDVGSEFITLALTRAGYKLYKRFGFDELEDDMRLAPEKDEIGCLPMYLSPDWEE